MKNWIFPKKNLSFSEKHNENIKYAFLKLFRALKYQYNSNRANRVEPAVVQDMRLLPAFPEIDMTTYVDRPEAHLLVT